MLSRVLDELQAVAGVLRGRTDALIVRCAWCGRLEVGADEWVTPTTWLVRKPSSLVAGATSHGICPSCLARVQARADADRARRRSERGQRRPAAPPPRRREPRRSCTESASAAHVPPTLSA